MHAQASELDLCLIEKSKRAPTSGDTERRYRAVGAPQRWPDEIMMNWIRSILAFATVSALTACSRKPEAEMQSSAASRKDVTTAHDATRLYGSVVEEYPLVYPEWEYGTGNEGCPYRFNGIMIQVDSEKHLIVVKHVSEREKLPNKGDSIVIHSSSLSVAHLGSVAGSPAYDGSKLEYEVVEQKANKAAQAIGASAPLPGR